MCRKALVYFFVALASLGFQSEKAFAQMEEVFVYGYQVYFSSNNWSSWDFMDNTQYGVGSSDRDIDDLDRHEAEAEIYFWFQEMESVNCNSSQSLREEWAVSIMLPDTAEVGDMLLIYYLGGGHENWRVTQIQWYSFIFPATFWAIPVGSCIP